MLDERHEIIQFSHHLPVKIFMHKLGIAAKHWHQSLELLLVLDGQIDIMVDDEAFRLQSEDIILINSNSIHEIHSEGAVMIALQLKLEMFSLLESDIENLVFDCNSSTDPDKEHYRGIQFAIAHMVHSNAHRSHGTDYRNYALSYYLIAELLDHFKIPATEALKTKKKYMLRLANIISYINEHYRENFSLSDLADSQQLSVPYLSSFFKKYMRINFTQYYINVKLEHAVQDLLNTDDSIETIAMRNGFTEPHAFVRAFKKKYEVLPSMYRKEKRRVRQTDAFPENLNYLLLEPNNYLHLLTKYIKINNPTINNLPSSDQVILEVPELSATSPARKLRHTFKTFITVGRAKDLLNHDIQVMLSDIQKQIGYRYIKFHGILSDDMMVCNRNSDGTLRFHYQLVDRALEFLLSIGLRPLIQLSFMPLALAANPDKNIGHRPFNTSPPKHMEEWNLLVSDFTRHLLEYFGRDEVLTWPFCVWNEPYTPKKMFGFGDASLFFTFYENTWNAVKSVCPDLKFGTPSLLYMENHGEPVWIKNFITFTQAHRCPPDFLNIHYYADIIPKEADDFVYLNAPASYYPTRTDDFSLFIGSIRKIFRTLGVGELPIYMTEWNFTMSHRNLINDTCFKSCYILKNLLKNYDRLDSFGYWSLTDLIEENPLPDNLFHGGLGIYTMNGLRKNVFYSFYFANMLGDDLIGSGDGWFVTRKKSSYQIITYNYIHYGDLFANGELFDITLTSRYSTFNMSKKLSVSVPLSDLKNGRYQLKEYFVNREHGSVFDLWVAMGGISFSSQDMELLKSSCAPGFHSEYRIVAQNQFVYTANLEPLEIRFAEILFLEDH